MTPDNINPTPDNAAEIEAKANELAEVKISENNERIAALESAAGLATRIAPEQVQKILAEARTGKTTPAEFTEKLLQMTKDAVAAEPKETPDGRFHDERAVGMSAKDVKNYSFSRLLKCVADNDFTGPEIEISETLSQKVHGDAKMKRSYKGQDLGRSVMIPAE